MSRIGDFTPRSPGGERLNNGVTPSNKVEFQSTLPGWGATHLHVGHAVRVDISIHAPRMGSDHVRFGERPVPIGFQSTLPGWGATTADPRTKLTVQFQSTLPGWGATPVDGRLGVRTLFQSTLPGWGATATAALLFHHLEFQSTLPGWGATAKMDIFAHDMGKIIHFQH